jgi:bifunctional non-homologous end joining protein LigD
MLTDKKGGMVKRTLSPPQIKSRIFSKHSFVIHRHQGSITHYHLRLEINGVVKSWLIPNGPSLNPRDRRLAIMVGDQYSFSDAVAGTEMWDKGTYASVGFQSGEDSVTTQIKDGNLKFVLSGKKLKGSFRLLQMKERGKNLWLLIKGNDQYAVDYYYNAEDFIKGNTPSLRNNYLH